MKLLFLFSLLVCWLTTEAQYSYFRSTIDCTTASKEDVAAGYAQLQTSMEAMKREGKVFGFYPEKKEKNKSTQLSFEVLAEDESQFKSIIAEWMDRNKTKSMEGFWKDCPGRKDTLVNKTKLLFPVIKDAGSPVAVVPIIEEKPDPAQKYNIVIDFTAFTALGETEKMDSSAVNWGLEEVGRIYNLHVAAGIPKENLSIVLAVHAQASKTFFTNAAYQKKFKRDNPNLPIIRALTDAGVKLMQCGQSATWMGFHRDMLVPELKMAMSAKTVITSHQMKGYALMNVKND